MVATGFYTNARRASYHGRATPGYFIRGNRDKSKISCSLMRRFVIIPAAGARVFPRGLNGGVRARGRRCSGSGEPCFCNAIIFFLLPFLFPSFFFVDANYALQYGRVVSRVIKRFIWWRLLRWNIFLWILCAGHCGDFCWENGRD